MNASDDPLSMNSVMTSVEDPKPQMQLVLDESAQQLNGSSAARRTQRRATTVRFRSSRRDSVSAMSKHEPSKVMSHAYFSMLQST